MGPVSYTHLDVYKRQELRNAYDNSIHYTDYVLGEIVDMLAKTNAPASMLYLSDHGEDIFDDSRARYLHASPIPTYYQLHIPYVIWFSKAYRESYPQKYLEAQAHETYPVKMCIRDREDAIRMNVSAMAVMLAIGDEAHEAKTVANLYKAVDKASRYNIPVMGVTAVGKQMARDARYFGLASRICAENGANIVKTYYCEGFEKVAAACPVPVVIAGGKKLPEKEALELCYNAINDGAAGVDMGRNVFQSTSPVAMIQAVHAVVHQGITPDQGYELFCDLAK